MRILKITLHGLRTLPATLNIVPEQGLNVWGTSKQQAPIVTDAIERLFYYNRYDPDLPELSALAGSACSGDLFIQTERGHRFLLRRDLTTAAAQLYSVDPKTNKGSLVSKDAQQIAQYLRSNAEFVDKRIFNELFLFSTATLPSTLAAPPEKSAEPLGYEDEPAAEHGPLSDEERQQLLAKRKELEGKIEAAHTIDELEFSLTGMQNERSRASQPLDVIDEYQEQVDKAQRNLKFYPPQMAGLPPDSEQQLANYRNIKQLYESDMQRWRDERSTLEHERKPIPPLSPHRQALFWIGILVGLIGIGVAFALGDVYRYAAFLDIPGFGLAAWLLIVYIDRLQRRAVHRNRLELSTARKGKLKEKYEQQLAAFEDVFARSGCESVDELEEMLPKYLKLQEQLTAAENRFKDLMQSEEIVQARKAVADYDERIADLEARLADMGALAIEDKHFVQEQIDAIDARLAGPEKKRSRTPTGSLLERIDDEVAAENQGVTWPKTYFDLAADMFAASPTQLKQQLDAFIGQVTFSLSGKRWKVGIDELHGFTVCNASNQQVEWEQLPLPQQDLLAIAMQVAIVSLYIQKRPYPVIFSRFFAAAHNGPTLGKVVLPFVSKRGQTLCFSAGPSFLPPDTKMKSLR